VHRKALALSRPFIERGDWFLVRGGRLTRPSIRGPGSHVVTPMAR